MAWLPSLPTERLKKELNKVVDEDVPEEVDKEFMGTGGDAWLPSLKPDERVDKNANWKLLSSHHCQPEATISSFPAFLPTFLRYTHKLVKYFLHGHFCSIPNADDNPKCKWSQSQIWRELHHFPPLHHFHRDTIFLRGPLIGAAPTWGKEYETGSIFCFALAVAIFPDQLQQGLKVFLTRGNLSQIFSQKRQKQVLL